MREKQREADLKRMEIKPDLKESCSEVMGPRSVLGYYSPGTMVLWVSSVPPASESRAIKIIVATWTAGGNGVAPDIFTQTGGPRVHEPGCFMNCCRETV